MTAVFVALYVAFNVVQMFSIGNPLISGPIQLRVADCLITSAALLGWHVIFGVTIGCVVANVISNMMYFLGPVDIIMGPFANFVAAGLVFLFWRRRLLACVVGALPVRMHAWLGLIASITLSSLIAVTVIGYSLLTILSRPSIIEPLKSRGLVVLEKS